MRRRRRRIIKKRGREGNRNDLKCRKKGVSKGRLEKKQ
jgi:hypothetical protein